MDAARFDSLATSRALTAVQSRRGIAGGLLLGATALLGLPSASVEAAPDGKSRKNLKQQLKRSKTQLKRTRTQLNRCKAKLQPHVCAGKNWCVDRSQTCGPASGYGKCLVQAGGGNTCAEILFQAKTCAACEEPVCNNCQCVLAAGGGDRCNNGATSTFDFICVRAV